jgi:hypothetical protein
MPPGLRNLGAVVPRRAYADHHLRHVGLTIVDLLNAGKLFADSQ